jgi:UDP-glucose 4-epimerase
MTVYGTDNPLPVKENGKLNPLSSYGLSKILAERIIEFYTGGGHCKCVSLRIPGVYGGDRRSGFIYNTIRKCLNQESVTINTTDLGYWECLRIDDLCHIIRQFLEHYSWEKNYEVFNIGYGKETDILACAQLIKELTNSRSEITVEEAGGYVPLFLSNRKIKKLVSIPGNLCEESLKNYIQSLQA